MLPSGTDVLVLAAFSRLVGNRVLLQVLRDVGQSVRVRVLLLLLPPPPSSLAANRVVQPPPPPFPFSTPAAAWLVVFELTALLRPSDTVFPVDTVAVGACRPLLIEPSCSRRSKAQSGLPPLPFFEQRRRRVETDDHGSWRRYSLSNPVHLDLGSEHEPG